MYSNISHQLGLTAIEYWLNTYPELINERFSKDMIIEFTEFILKNNIFQFNNIYFQQVKGTAMGSKFAPTYAALTIGYLEIKLYEEMKSQFSEDKCIYIENNFKRFLDDCFMIWLYLNDDLKKFCYLLNSLDPDIKFVMESSEESIPFLDVKVLKKEGDIITDIFYKITDSKQYLRFDSCHPKHTKLNIPYTLSKRICTIVSDNDIKHRRLQELKDYLIDLKYPEEIIQNGIKKALIMERKDLLKSNKTKDTFQIIPYISTHNPNNSNTFSQIKNNFNILTSDPNMKEIMKNRKIISCKKQPPNLKRILTKSSYCEKEKIPLVEKCGKPRCSICDIIITGDKYKFNNNKTIEIKVSMNCTVLNCIYVIKCENCNFSYIGETCNLRSRIALHKSQIKNDEYCILKVSNHLRNCNKNSKNCFKIMPIFKLFNNCSVQRKIKEDQLIKLFQPELNVTD